MDRKLPRVVWLVVTIVLAGLLLVCLLMPRFAAADSEASDGEIMIRDFGERVTTLSGEWDFYWQRLLTYEEIGSAEERMTADIPGVWNSIEQNGEPLGGYGYGTYHLTVHGLEAGQETALYIPLLSVSYAVYVDGRLVASNGVVSETQEGFVPSFLPQTAYFAARGSDADIVVHTSNYVYARNGMWHSISIGTAEQISALNRIVIYKDLFFIGAFITLAIYYACTYALRREKQSLLFVSLCIGAVIRMMVNGDRMIVRLFPDFPFELVVKCDYLAILLFYPILLLLMTRRFSGEFSRRAAFISCGVGVAGSLFVLILPVSVFTQYVTAAEALLFLNILYTAAMLWVSAMRKRKSALPMFASVLLLLSLTAYDTLYQMGKIDSSVGEISAFGFFTFLLIESYAISKDYAESFQHVQELSVQLMESDRLKERIRKTEMAFLQSQIKPHFLYNTLSVIDEYCIVDPHEASRLIGSLAQYLRQSFGSRNLEDCIPVNMELSLVKNYVEIEQARFDDLIVAYDLDYGDEFSLPPLTIQPLVENAIRHGVRRQSGPGRVAISIRRQPGTVSVSIRDNGAGIPADKLETLLSVPTDSVGLINIHNRLLHMYGKGLAIQSAVGEGTTVSFTIPVMEVKKCV